MHTAPPPRPAPVMRLCLRWLAVSLALRAAFAWLLRAGEAVPVYDEFLYLSAARAWAALFGGLLGGGVPDGALDAAYGGGVWPPLHPILLSLPLAAGLPDAACRLVPLLLGAATTPLVWLFARAVVPPRAAFAAACLHLLSPCWLAFSHLLLSETPFLFFLAAAGAALVRIRRPDRPFSPAMAALAGLCLGGAGLCRAAVLPLVPVFLAAAALLPPPPRRPAARLLPPLLLLLAFAAATAPWQLWLWRKEAPARPLLSTSAGYNLLLGNNPHIPEGYGSAWFLPEAELARRDLQRFVRTHAPGARPEARSMFDVFARDDAARRLASRYRREAPAAVLLARAARRLLFTLGPDVFLPLHLCHAAYPARGFPFIAALALAEWSFGLALLAACAAGLARREIPPRRRLFLALAAAAAVAPALVSVGIPRLAQPALLLLLPLAGAALCRPAAGWPPARARLLPAALALAAAYLQPLPQIVARHLKPCAVYLPGIAPAARALGVAAEACDVLAFRNDTGRPLLLALETGDPRRPFTPPDGPPQRKIALRLEPGAAAANPRPMVRTPADAAGAPLALEAALLTPSGEVRRRAAFQTLAAPAEWRVWRETGIPGVRFRWEGGGLPPPDGPR